MVKVLFVGCGAALEQLYQKPLQAMEARGWLGVAGVVDPAPKRREAAAAMFRQAAAFPDMAAAFAALGEVDLAIIASPPAFHAAQAAVGFEHNCHVLCEKPMAHSIAAAEEMTRLALEHERILAIGMVRRFYPAVAAVKQWLADPAHSGPLEFVYREGSIFDWPVASPALFRRDTGGGGVLIDKGVHALDMLHFIFGPGRVLRSADDADAGGGVEANAAVDLEFGPRKGVLQISWETPLNNGFHLATADDELWLPLSPIDTVWSRKRIGASAWSKLDYQATWPADLTPSHPKMATPGSFAECFNLQLVSVLRSIQFGEPPIATGKDGLDVLRLVMGAYGQPAPLNQPWLPAEEQSATRASHWRSEPAKAAAAGDKNK